jgi:hypothetical protein
MKTMEGAGYDARESDPFAPEQVFSPLAQGTAPIVGSIRTLLRCAMPRWKAFRRRPVCRGQGSLSALAAPATLSHRWPGPKHSGPYAFRCEDVERDDSLFD